jgi:hypothetical protein
VLDLCLSVPADTGSITLTAQFTKAFLRMLEHPPDAHRGFDVPPAVITVGDVPVQPTGPGCTNVPKQVDPDGNNVTGSSRLRSSGGSSSSRGSVSGGVSGSSRRWHVVVADGVPDAEELWVVTPLMAQLMQQQPALVSFTVLFMIPD